VSRRRIVPAVLAALLASTLLAGCKSNVGTAARVDGTRISESDVNQYVEPRGVSSQVAAQASGANRRVAPRSIVLSILILEQIYEKTLENQHVRVTDGALTNYHDDAGSGILGGQLPSASVDREVNRLVAQYGLSSAFGHQLLRMQELKLMLVDAKRVSTQAQFDALVKPVASRVTVTARYGTWDAENLGLSNEPALPSFITAQGGSGGGA